MKRKLFVIMLGVILTGVLSFVIAGGESTSESSTQPSCQSPAQTNQTSTSVVWSSSLNTAKNVSYLTTEEKKVIFEINKVRTNPKKYAEEIVKPVKDTSKEAKELYYELLKTVPRKPLQPNKGLSLAARDHAKDIGGKGIMSHTGSDGSTMIDRIKWYGSFSGIYGAAENIACGLNKAEDIVRDLLIDRGVPGRGHRKNILIKEMTQVGVSIQPHSKYKYSCVQAFAEGYTSK
ncbi:CAP domain-containing protein [Candidatus Margulisiibacteriota bacterium]